MGGYDLVGQEEEGAVLGKVSGKVCLELYKGTSLWVSPAHDGVS